VTEPEPDPDADRPTMAPFLGALTVIVLVVMAVVLFNAFGSSDTTPEQDVRRAVVGQNDAMQRQSYADFRDFTCRAEQVSEADFLARQRDSVVKTGERYVDDVLVVRIDGDRATTVVTYHFDRTVDTTSGSELTVIREDGTWKVCSPGVV
jgi:hypothetical protein